MSVFHWPFLKDTTGKPSVTLLFAYVSFLIAAVSIVVLHFFPTCFSGTIAAIVFFVLCAVLYRMRRIDDLKLNFKTGSLEVDDKDGA